MSTAPELARSRGYRVDTHDGRIGSVLAVLPRTGCELPGMLLVKSGLLSCRVAAVPFDDVEGVDSERRIVQLRALPQTMREAAPRGGRDRIVARA